MACATANHARAIASWYWPGWLGCGGHGSLLLYLLPSLPQLGPDRRRRLCSDSCQDCWDFRCIKEATIIWKRLAHATYHQGGTLRPRFYCPFVSPSMLKLRTLVYTSFCVQQSLPDCEIQIPDPRCPFEGEREGKQWVGAPAPPTSFPFRRREPSSLAVVVGAF